ncbi:hypothetical protein RHRU231_450245 [Rhodococcus ruber]|uniref:Uncharacterized protein n=1 Tax=Rhodococcus ruber TaxID=1830 RepID=A0A098BK49_9NOCA|nr:hypothetical protein RHRU231_450245 [Rhodococcus ruber]
MAVYVFRAVRNDKVWHADIHLGRRMDACHRLVGGHDQLPWFDGRLERPRRAGRQGSRHGLGVAAVHRVVHQRAHRADSEKRHRRSHRHPGVDGQRHHDRVVVRGGGRHRRVHRRGETRHVRQRQRVGRRLHPHHLINHVTAGDALTVEVMHSGFTDRAISPALLRTTISM